MMEGYFTILMKELSTALKKMFTSTKKLRIRSRVRFGDTLRIPRATHGVVTSIKVDYYHNPDQVLTVLTVRPDNWPADGSPPEDWHTNPLGVVVLDEEVVVEE